LDHDDVTWDGSKGEREEDEIGSFREE